MIIVSQDKNSIINFDNILQLYISRYIEETITEYCIRYEDCNNSYEEIGAYKTEERAKEVLQEIVENYRKNIIHGSSSCFGSTKVVYEMPED